MTYLLDISKKECYVYDSMYDKWITSAVANNIRAVVIDFLNKTTFYEDGTDIKDYGRVMLACKADYGVENKYVFIAISDKVNIDPTTLDDLFSEEHKAAPTTIRDYCLDNIL